MATRWTHLLPSRDFAITSRCSPPFRDARGLGQPLLAAANFPCALDPVSVNRCSVRKGSIQRFSGQATPADFCNVSDTRAHLERAFDPRFESETEVSLSNRRGGYSAAREQHRCDASVVRRRSGAREIRPC